MSFVSCQLSGCYYLTEDLKPLLWQFTPQFFGGNVHRLHNEPIKKLSYNAHFWEISKQVKITEIVVNKGQIGPDRGRSVVSFAVACVAGRRKGGKSK